MRLSHVLWRVSVVAGGPLLLAIAGIPIVRGQDAESALSVPRELRTYAFRISGADPIDCGQHLLVPPFVAAGSEQLQRSLVCTSDAAKNRKAFWTLKQDQGMDSLLFQGLLGTTKGKIYQFSYDSAPCGGPWCPGRFDIVPCDQPTVITRANGAEFGCKR
jgi:hypothetical protein